MIDIEVDFDGYPSDRMLKQIREMDWVRKGAIFLVDILPKISDEITYAHCRVTNNDKDYYVEFVTCGWSGCEDIIDAILSTYISTFYYNKWKSGGYHRFRVPISKYLKEKKKKSNI